jgi:predicted P-loop ATPase
MQVTTKDSPKFVGWEKYITDAERDEPPIECRLAVRISEDAVFSLIDFLDEHRDYDAARLGWDLRRQHDAPDGMGQDMFETLFAANGGRHCGARDGHCDRLWASFDRERVQTDRLLVDEMDDAINEGWEAPSDIAAEIEKLRDIQVARAARHKAAERVGIVECNRFFGEVVRSEFEAAQKAARANPQWFTTQDADDNWTDSVPAIQKVIDTAVLPPSNIIIGFTRLVDDLAAADAQEAAHSDMMEAVAAGALTLSQEVQRGCRDMAHMKDYVRDAKGLPEATNPDNVYFLLRSIDCEVRFNAWLERMEIKGDSPLAEPHLRWPEWTYVDDTIVAMLRTFAQRTTSRFCTGKDFFWDSMLTLATKNTVDPAIDLLAKLEVEWDGTNRIDTWLSATCGVPADAYHAAVGRNIVGGMVKRMRKPGAKHDEIALMVGPEGTGKSSFIAALAPQPEWFTESIRLGDEPKELVLSLAGKAVAEISEMSASTKDVAAIKAMISRTTDAGRTAYARSVTERPRRNIFVASTNDDQVLMSDTGNRRFLPVRIDQAIDNAWLLAHGAQLIGEAAALESSGETFALPRAVWSDAGERQEASRQVAEYELHLAEWFVETPLAIYVTAADLSDLVKSAAGRSVSAKGYTKVMRKLGFIKATRRTDGKPAAVWHRGDLAIATRVTTQQIGTRTVARIGHLPVPQFDMPAATLAMPPLPAA